MPSEASSGVGSPAAEVTGVCELPNVSAWEPGPLEGQQCPLARETSPALCLFFYFRENLTQAQDDVELTVILLPQLLSTGIAL